MKKIKILLGILVLAFLCFTPVNAENLKFIQVTDVHLTQNNKGYLEELVSDLNKKYSDLDFVIFTGDNIDNANVEDLKTFLSIIKELKFKKYVIMGNHDVFKSHGLDKKLYMSLVKKELGSYHSNKPNYVFKDKDVVFITMDGVKEVIPGPNGYYREEELNWLDKQLDKYKNNKVVIVQHFPLIVTDSKMHKLYRRDDYMEMLKNHNNVIGIISGHYHKNIEENLNGIYNIATMKFDNENEYYKVIEIDKESSMIFTQLNSKTDE